MESVMNGQMRANKSAVAGGSMISGMGSLSGTVKAPKEFKAAKVYAHNLDKNVVYMVYTVGGKYSMTDLFPGNYEVSVIKSGFNGGEVQKVSVTAGASATADLTMQEGTYPAGEGRQIIEKTCIRCHGPDFLPGKQWDADQWNAAIDLMLSTATNSNPPGRISEASVPGLIPPHDRQVL